MLRLSQEKRTCGVISGLEWLSQFPFLNLLETSPEKIIRVASIMCLLYHFQLRTRIEGEKERAHNSGSTCFYVAIPPCKLAQYFLGYLKLMSPRVVLF